MSKVEEFDTVELAKCTRDAISILLPWCQVAVLDCNLPLPANEVAKQAEEYMRAIHLGMEAAEHGFAIAEEAIDLGESLACITEDERLKYLKGMIQLAIEGREKAEQTMIAFSSVRARIESLIADLQSISFSLHEGPSYLYDPHYIEKWIPPLSQFSCTVLKFADWWSFVSLEDGANRAKAEVLLRFYSRIKEEQLVGSWKKLQLQHAKYIFEIDMCISQHPQFLEVLEKFKKKSQVHQKAPSFTTYDTCSEETVVKTASQDYLEVLNKLMYFDVPVTAIFQSVRTIQKDTTEFVVQFECGSSHKIKQLKIEWKFKSIDQKDDNDGPRIMRIAPMSSVGYLGQETVNNKRGLEVPLGFNLAGFNLGANIGIEHHISKTAHYGMSIVGVNQRMKCSWILKENQSSASGIPPHFRLRFTLKHKGTFSMSLKADAKIKIYRYMPSKRREIGSERSVDVARLQNAIATCSLGAKGGDDDFNGEVPNAYTTFQQPAVPR